MNLTLKQYLQHYHINKSSNSNTQLNYLLPINQKSIQQLFDQQLFNIKKIIKRHIQKIDIISLINQELQQLRNIFTRNKNMMSNPNRHNTSQPMCYSKKIRNHVNPQKKQHIQIPISNIHNELQDQLRTIFMDSNKKISTQPQQQNYQRQKYVNQKNTAKQNTLNQSNFIYKIKGQQNTIKQLRYSTQQKIPTFERKPHNLQNKTITPSNKNKSIYTMMPSKLLKMQKEQNYQLKIKLISNAIK